jgi:hypothetical protein
MEFSQLYEHKNNNVQWLMAINCTLEESVLLEYDAASLGNWFATFQDNIAVLPAKVKMSKCHSSRTLKPLQDETTMLVQNIRYQLHSVATSLSRRTGSSTTLSQTPKNLQLCTDYQGACSSSLCSWPLASQLMTGS